MKNLITLLLVLSISCYLQTANAQTFYFLWDTCNEELINFSKWYNTNVSLTQLYEINYLFQCPTYSSDIESIEACENQIFSRGNLGTVVSDFYYACYRKEFDYYLQHKFDNQKCLSQTNECMECLLDSQCDSFKKSNYSRIKELSKFTSINNPNHCEQLNECQNDEIGFFAQGECQYFYRYQCKKQWAFEHAINDQCLGMEYCNPYVKESSSSSTSSF